ncbi:MAG: inositol-3-phosphate synthase [Planctomycetes bacterium]|nr:inositol-3-phosphate synthase [Planctomycetota bacterium]
MASSKKKNLLVYIIGAAGNVSVLVQAGVTALARKIASPTGILTENPEFAGAGFRGFDRIVFGGTEIREVTLAESLDIYRRQNKFIEDDAMKAAISALEKNQKNVMRRIPPGISSVASSLGLGKLKCDHPREYVLAIQSHIDSLKRERGCDLAVVVNLASTEPARGDQISKWTLAEFERDLTKSKPANSASSALAAYAAIGAGHPYLNFTPSVGSEIPALTMLAERTNAPHAGKDGKTGETLLKTTLGPMFVARGLNLLSWQAYNMLGNTDGQVLSEEANLKSKLVGKDAPLRKIAGAGAHLKTSIDFVPSLADQKTAMDFVHFEGFLGSKMTLSFTWQGYDSALAAPLVIDLVRLLDVAAQRGESGPQRHLASYFKSPIAYEGAHDFHVQFECLLKYIRSNCSRGSSRS